MFYGISSIASNSKTKYLSSSCTIIIIIIVVDLLLIIMIYVYHLVKNSCIPSIYTMDVSPKNRA